ncbi:MAG: FAD-dependent oxidoreductase [Patescibacteria group bacterium]
MSQEEIKKTYKVIKNRVETHDTATLDLVFEDGSVPQYKAGQFITIYFPEIGTPEGKAYSISSSPSEKGMSITIKAIGLFSKRLCAMKPGDAFIGSLPYGYFFSESDRTPLVLVAGGIGVTPFRGMILDSFERTPHRKIILFQSCKTVDDIVFKKDFEDLARKHPQFKPIFFVTRQESPDPSHICRRIEVMDIVGKNSPKEKEYFICGSIPFVGDLWKALRKKGVAEEMICTEAFFSH